MSFEAICNCQLCNGQITFPLRLAGKTTQCPHCQTETLLFAPPSAEALRAEQVRAGLQKSQQKKQMWVNIIGWSAICGVLLAILFFLRPSASDLKTGVGSYFAGVTGIISIIVGLFVYFIPTIIGLRKRNAVAIFMLNLFLGWTFIGWVVALVWAFTVDNEQKS